ncbi:trypsin-like serine protease [Vibrio gallicus]|uniref:trypsin-like serine protease n=1 Tax=Vibrio gallicus TaxID=190897 RepID=UPI0021C46644|nr:trypsin-like serine protease [Vibrio gallicus]
MPRALSVISCLIGCLASGGAVANSGGNSTYIVNGINVSIEDFPSFSSLYFDQLDTSGLYQNYCGATILDAYHVLTAAHCVEGDSYYYTYTSVAPQVQNERQVLQEGAELVRASEFYYPDGFVDSEALSWPDDIAIIKLEQPLSVPPSAHVTLATPSDIISYNVAGIEMFTIGHGFTTDSSDTTNTLQGVIQTLLSNSSCRSADIGSRQLCLQGEVDFQSSLRNSTCGGDSGGPLYWNRGGEYIQVGITSFGPSLCGDPNADYSSAYTEVAEYSTWINRVLTGQELPKIVVTQSNRDNFVPSDEDNGISDDDTGGAVGLFSLFGFGVLVWLRRRST